MDSTDPIGIGQIQAAMELLGSVQPDDEGLRQRLKHWHAAETRRLKTGQLPQDYAWLDELEVPATEVVRTELAACERRIKVLNAVLSDLSDELDANPRRFYDDDYAQQFFGAQEELFDLTELRSELVSRLRRDTHRPRFRLRLAR